ncbi:allophanate hydrolase [Muricoccus aerilatus]|uniref:allophanate hydrolase n=1 Tax=Muricoccus aerilatus TaxID=452982 RepID=UPI0005C25F4A|nr:allophanate hydrolase [Roseomonas aerilata]
MLWDLARAEGPEAAARAALDRIEAWADPALFIHRIPAAEVMAEAARLAAEGPMGRPLYGIPYVIKDNIEAAGLPTTAACPDFTYVAAEDAPAVARLRAAGAVLLGKVNLDQFATGLVGVRSPYGTPRNAVDAACVPGGSSSGSASAVSAGIAAFSLGTDTAGSGRVPAMFQNIVGLKPSLGLVPTRGVVPACRSLDVVSVFALTVEQAAAVLDALAGPDAADPYSRAAPAGWRATGGGLPPALRVAVPEDADLLFDTADDEALFRAALSRLEGLGAVLERVSIAPFLALARRLYDGAWVAERTSALRDMVENHPGSLHPTTRIILEGGLSRLTVDAFDDFHAVASTRLLSRALFTRFDLLAVPTAPGIPTLETLAAEPIAANSRCGTYTNFVNLLDLSALALPSGFRADKRPAGITLIAPAFAEARLCAVGAALHHAAGLPLGATGEATPPPAPAAGVEAGEIPLFCIGAHMSGLPLNGQVTALGGRFLRRDRTAPGYRLYALGNRPGLIRDGEGGASIEGEVWAVPAAGIGPLLAQVPPPLGFGTVVLESGPCLGFLAEPSGLVGAPEITSHGGWRAYLAAR